MNYQIGIIVLHFGKVSYTDNCIQSILQSNFKNFQILVIDNSSEEVFKNDPKQKNLNLIRMKENLGFAAAMNIGIKNFIEQEINFFLLLNNDTILKPNTLDAFLTAATSNVNAIFAPILLKLNTNTPIEYGGSLNEFTMYFKDLITVPTVMQKVSYITGACLFFSRETFDTMGYLPEEYFMYSEDMDYCILAKKKNIPLFLLPSAIVYHEKGGSSGGLSPFTIYYIHRNRFLLGRKYNTGLKFILFLLFYILLMIGKTMKWFFINRDYIKWFWYGFIDGLKGSMGKSKRKLSNFE